MMSEIVTLLQNYLTIPVTSATSERSHSALKRVKTDLRNRMTAKSMNNAIMRHIYKHQLDKLDLVNVAKSFTQIKSKSVNKKVLWFV